MELSEIWLGIIIPIAIGPIFIYLKTIRDEISYRDYERKKNKYDEEKKSLYNELKQFYWPVYINLLCIEQYSYSIPLKNKFRYESESSNYSSQNSEALFSDDSNDYFTRNYNENKNKNKTINPSEPIVKEIDLDGNNYEIVSDSSNDNFEVTIPIIDTDNIKINIDNEPNIKKKSNELSFRKYSTCESKLPNINIEKTIIIDKITLGVFEKNLNTKFKEVISIIEENMPTICIHENLNKEVIKFIKYAKVREIIHEGSPEREYNIEYFGVENNCEVFICEIKKILTKLNNRYEYLVNNPI